MVDNDKSPFKVLATITLRIDYFLFSSLKLAPNVTQLE